MENGDNTTPIQNIEQAHSKFEQRYQFLKDKIIAEMREREGTWHIDFAKASNIASGLAEQLPDNVVLSTEPEPEQPREPRWLTVLVICAVIIAIAGFAFVIAGWV